MEASDAQIVARARQGDAGAFERLWQRHLPVVTRLCRHLLRGAPDPVLDEDDLAAETFVRVLHQLDQYEERPGTGGFPVWLRQVARSTCLNALERQRQRRRWLVHPPAGDLDRVPEAGPGPLDRVLRRELLRAAAAAVHALPERYRAPFRLYLEERSHQEIAQALGISPVAARKQVERARLRLQRQLAPLLPDEASRAALRAVERALSEIVTGWRIVTLTLPHGGEFQLRLRVDPEVARAEGEIEARRLALTRRPAAWRKRLELAEICYHSGRWAEAREEYRRVLDQQPACAVSALRLGEILRREERPEAAARVYRAALARGEVDPAAGDTLRAALLLAEGRNEAAAAAAREAIAGGPRQLENYALLHEALARLNRYEEQLENLARQRRVAPRELSGYVEAFTPCARLGRFDLALPLLERAVELDPNDPLVVKTLFLARMNLRRFDQESLGLAERMVRLTPAFASSWGALAWILSSLGREEEALRVLRQYVADHPRSAEGHASLAWRCHYMDQPGEVGVHARRAYELAPEDSYICWTLLTACGTPGAIPRPEALQFVQEIAARHPQHDRLAQSVAELYLNWGEAETGIEHARRAVALAPGSLEAQMVLARAYRDACRWREAAAAFEQLVRMPGGGRPAWLAWYAAMLRAAGDPRAAEVFAEAEVLADESGDDLERANLYEAWGRRVEAAAAFRRCLAATPVPDFVRRNARSGLERLAGISP